MSEPTNLYALVLHQAAQRRAGHSDHLARQLERIEAKNGNHAQEQRQPTEREPSLAIVDIVSARWLR